MLQVYLVREDDIKLTKLQARQRRWMMISGALAIFFTGYPHVWSVYQPYMIEQAGWSREQASMCFYLTLCIFVFGNIIGGRIQDKCDPRLVVFAGGGISTVGILLSAFLIVSSPLPIYFTYGVMQGLGQGMIYATIVSTAQKWFPGRTGFASGLIVTANGLCGFFLAPFSRYLLETGGPKLAFLVVGTASAVVWILSSLFFCVPDPVWRQEEEARINRKGFNEDKKTRQYTASGMIRTKSFYFLLATMFLGLISYFIISPVSQTHQVDLGIPASIAVSAVMAGSLANAGARLLFPTLADKIGRLRCIRGVLTTAAAAMVILSVSYSYAAVAAIVIMYGCYGGIMGIFPSFTSAVFGMEHSGENYGLVMLGIVFATFGAPMITSIVERNGYGMHAVFAVGAVSAIAAIVFTQLLKRELRNME